MCPYRQPETSNPSSQPDLGQSLSARSAIVIQAHINRNARNRDYIAQEPANGRTNSLQDPSENASMRRLVSHGLLHKTKSSALTKR
jgi:hypothetical protein